jgi:hypothetical protein
MKKLISSLFLGLFIAGLVGCTQTTCPTYSKAPVEKKVEAENDQKV